VENITNEINEFEELLMPLYKHISAVLNSKLTGDITFGQLSVLNRINQGIKTVSELSIKQAITPAASSKFVDQLVKLKYVMREQDEKDRRICNLQITENGIKILNENMALRQQILEKFLNSLTEEEKINLKNIMNKVNKMLCK
jgi:DNA-binding MarR family transcriptional regulator